LIGLLALTPSCERVKGMLNQNQTAEAAAAGAAGAAGGGAEANSAGAGGSADEVTEEVPVKQYALPFVWETASDEPLARARAYLKEVVSDNGTYSSRGAKFFAGLKEVQAPRATVVTCSDSQVNNRAWHGTPENDDFVIRNLGNQIKTTEGSIEYGVEQLHTPLLLIVGHSGCDAIKAAMSDIETQSKGMQAELKTLSLPEPNEKDSERDALKNGVLANVHNQVAYAVKKFGELVQEGKLTVVGSIYDHGNDLSEGAGKLVIVNVNGNSDPKRMKAFTEAINASPKGEARATGDRDTEGGREERGHDEHASPKRAATDINKTIEAVSEILNQQKTAHK
jgi:carbonic anhydrase